MLIVAYLPKKFVNFITTPLSVRTDMAQLKSFLGGKCFSALKNQAYGWGKVFGSQQGATVEEFIRAFQFDKKFPNHEEAATPKKGPTVNTIKRTVFWWMGDKKQEMMDFLSASSKLKGFSLSRKDRLGNTYMCFALLLTHTHVLKTDNASVQIHICLVQTNTQATSSLPLDFANHKLTKTHLPSWHPAMQFYLK